MNEASQSKANDWPTSIDVLKHSIVKITTPRGSGTGFIISSVKGRQLYGIATAAHVVKEAHYWEEPIRITHPESGHSFVAHQTERVIFLDETRDSAVIVVQREDGTFPTYSLPLVPKEQNLRIGHEVGWLGFPSVSPDNLCFFSGKASCWLDSDKAYLIDGVAINGVSGGPAFHLGEHFPVVIGFVSAYLPNRVTGDTLPGLSVVRDVAHFHEMVDRFRTLEEAKEEAPHPNSNPPEPPMDSSNE